MAAALPPLLPPQQEPMANANDPAAYASLNGKPASSFGYPQSVDLGASAEFGQLPPVDDTGAVPEPKKRVRFADEEWEDYANPIPKAILLNLAGFVTVMLVFCTLYNAVALLQHPLYFYFAKSTTPVALMIIIVIVLFWYAVPRMFKVEYPTWEAGCSKCCPTVPGCCLPGCPSCPTVPGCPSFCQCPPCGGDVEGCSARFPTACPQGCCGACISCCPGADVFCNSPCLAAKIFIKQLRTNTDFLLVVAVTLVLLYVWTTILSYFKMGFLDVIPGLHSLCNFFLSPLTNLSLSLPDNIHLPHIEFKLPALADVMFVFHAIGSFLGAPPLVLLATFFGTIFLGMLMMAILNNYANLAAKDRVVSANIWGNSFSIWGTFMLAVGTIFIIAGLPIVKEARVAQTELFDDCKTGTKTRNLFVASQALQALRSTPKCAKEMTVEDCDGFEDTPYTGLLKYMETTFQCSGFCYDSTGVPRGALWRKGPTEDTPSLMQTGSMSSDTSNRAGLETEKQEAATHSEGIILDVPPSLFSKELYMVSCDGMAARDMAHYVGRIGNEIYFQGLLLVTLSLVVLLLRLTGTPWNNKAKTPLTGMGLEVAPKYGAVRY